MVIKKIPKRGFTGIFNEWKRIFFCFWWYQNIGREHFFRVPVAHDAPKIVSVVMGHYGWSRTFAWVAFALRVRCTAYALKAQPARCAGLTVTMDAHLLDNVPWRLTSRTTKLRFTVDGCSVFLFFSKIDGECTEFSSHLSLLSCLLTS